MRAVADGRRPDAQQDSEGHLVPDLSVLEPVLAFSQVRWHDGTGLLRVHLSLSRLMRAAEEWDQRLARFPLR
ncbi:hypothetical protein GCM10010255_79430 [Streptomyces coeruleofuscus]|uniref:Uncharacterized protein n=1 Tax=Streptomyces coeruleofuscus TaxID=66879 RepID=A0ABP5WFB5_9ACTN